MVLIRVKNLSKIYMPSFKAQKEITDNAVIKALDNINLEIEAGDYVAICGPSGSGKSTLMQILGLLDKPSSGTYDFLEHDVSSLDDNTLAFLRSKYIGFVFQFFNLLSKTSALDNVKLPLIYAKSANQDKKAKDILKRVGLENRLYHKPSQLSGGQQQRVAIARALVNNPYIIFADEPTGNVNQDQAKEIMAYFKELNLQGVTIVLVTHDNEIAKQASRIINIVDGKILSDSRLKPFLNNSVELAGSFVSDTKVTFKGALILFRENVLMALKALVVNKLRSVLSMLGILIGVAAVVAMLAIGRGAQEDVKKRLESLGSNAIMVWPSRPKSGSPRFGGTRAATLTLEDAQAIKNLKFYGYKIKNISSIVQGNVNINYANKNWFSSLRGVNATYQEINNLKLPAGRFFNNDEDLQKQKVVLLGNTVYTNLFGQNPIGAIVKINRIGFKVIGLLPIKGSSRWGDEDDVVIIPLNTAMQRVLGLKRIHSIQIQVEQPQDIPMIMDKIKELLRKRHQIHSNQEDDFTVRSMVEIQETISATIKTISLLLGAIAMISLVVGGVGIMNIMLVSVKERTREIGLRKALGARKKDILLQFLVESTVMGILGGVFGLSLGIVISVAISYFLGWSTVIVLKAIYLSFIFSFAVGVIFGYWPAYQAANLSPIEALRYE